MRLPASKQAALGLLVAAAALGIATVAFPWASYRQFHTGSTTTFQGGPIAVAVVGIALAVSVTAIVIWVHPTRWLLSVAAVLGAAALATSVALALNKINAANSAAMPGPGQTSYSYGSGVGLVAALAVLIVAGVSRSAHRAVPTG